MENPIEMNNRIVARRLTKFIAGAGLMILIVFVFAGCFSAATKSSNASKGEKWSQNMVESHGLGEFYTNRVFHSKLSNTGWDYVSGLVASSVLKAWELY